MFPLITLINADEMCFSEDYPRKSPGSAGKKYCYKIDIVLRTPLGFLNI